MRGGPYQAPPVQVGDRISDLRRGECVVRSIRRGWPWGKPPGGRNDGPILCGDLIVAVRTESVDDIRQWLGVSENLVKRWRKALGVTDRVGYWSPTDEQLAALGTAPDAELAERFGVPVYKIEKCRRRHGIAAYDGPRPRRCPQCGTRHDDPDWRRVYCSERCADEAARKHQRKAQMQWLIRQDSLRLRKRLR